MFNSSQESSHSTKRHKDSSQGKNSRQSKNKSPALQDSPAFLKDLNSSPGPSNKITNNKSSKNNTRVPVSSEYKEEQNREYKGNNKQGFKIPKRLTQKDTAATKYKSRTPLENVRRATNVRQSYNSINDKKPCDLEELHHNPFKNPKTVHIFHNFEKITVPLLWDFFRRNFQGSSMVC